MANEYFHIWKGNVIISVDNDAKNLDNQEKFDTCKNRSPDQENITIQTCCSSVVRKGFRCRARDIDFLSPSVCGPCPVYAPKENSETQSGQAPELGKAS